MNITWCLVTLVLAALHVSQVQAQVSTPPPNIVFLLADDLRAGALGCEGNTIAKTPHIDRLAKEGVRFSNGFVTTSICSVSRASIFLGQYARRHKITNFSSAFSDEQWGKTYPALIRKAGYYTGFVGKFGVGDAKDIRMMESRFDFWKGVPGQGGPFIDPQDPEGMHATARFGEDAIRFIETAPAGKPLCLSVSFTAPHARDGKPREFEPDRRDEKLYEDVAIPVPEKASNAYYAKLPEVAKDSEGRERWKARFATPEMYQRTVKDYLRLVTGIDREVGGIRAALDARGLTTNTVFIFTSDNGFFYGERGLADKWVMYEESIRVPLIVFDPRDKDSGTTSVVEELVLNIDMAPTILELAGVDVPAEMQGKSLVPLLSGKGDAEWRTDFFYEHHFGENRKPPIPATEGVRERRWKYTMWTSAEPVYEELFDLEKDPGELHNLIDSPEHGSELDRLRKRREQYLQELQ